MADERYDVAVIGGGASGLAAAIAAGRAGARVAVLECDVACGLTILATGNGRCNLGNVRLDPARYRDPAAARAVMGERPEAACAAFFDSLGIMTCEIDGRLYPVTRRAESVRDALLAAAARVGVEELCGTEVVDAVRGARGWVISAYRPARPICVRADANGRPDIRRARKELRAVSEVPFEIRARSLIVACGGAAVGDLCDLLGLPYADGHPVLCPVACELAGRASMSLADLDGVRVEGALTLESARNALYRETGEVLFRPYGISGIVAFDLSRRVRPGDELALDLFPGMETGSLIGALRRREDAIGTFDGDDPAWFDGMLARPISRLVFDLLAGELSAPSDGMRGDLVTRCAKLLKGIGLTVTGLADARQAQVRRGGIPLTPDVIDLSELRVRGGACAVGDGGADEVCGSAVDRGDDAVAGEDAAVFGDGDAAVGAGDSGSGGAAEAVGDDAVASAPLFACGEALDQDADCGGFNLAWAWLSGLRAGRAAAKVALSEMEVGAA